MCNLNDIEIEDGKCIFATNNVEDEKNRCQRNKWMREAGMVIGDD